MTDELERIAAGSGAAARQARQTLLRRAARARGRHGEDDVFAPLFDTISDLAARMRSGERRRMATEIATELRNANAKRERTNVQPGGDPMTPRKHKGGKARSVRLREGPPKKRDQLMFRKAWRVRFLKKQATTDGAAIGFTGAMARIMSVHQYGKVDHVSKEADAPEVKYTERVVLGWGPEDRLRVLERITAQAAP